MQLNYNITDGKIKQTNDSNAQIIVFENPDDIEKNIIMNSYSIDEHNMLSALDPNEVSRMEFEDNYASIIYKKPKNYSSQDEFTFKAFTVGVFYFKERIIIVIGESIILFEDKFFNKVETLSDIILKLLNEAINHFMMHLRVINMITEELETKNYEGNGKQASSEFVFY